MPGHEILHLEVGVYDSGIVISIVRLPRYLSLEAQIDLDNGLGPLFGRGEVVQIGSPQVRAVDELCDLFSVLIRCGDSAARVELLARARQGGEKPYGENH